MFLLETGLPLWLSWYRLCLQCGRPGFDPWVRKIPWRRERPPTPVFWPREFHGLYSPRGRKESDSTGRLSLSLSRNRRPSCFCRLHLRQSVLGIMGVGYLMLTLIQRWIWINFNPEVDLNYWHSWLKAQHSENEDHGIRSHHFMGNRWGNSGNSVRLFLGGLQNHCRWWLQPWN